LYDRLAPPAAERIRVVISHFDERTAELTCPMLTMDIVGDVQA
jgi:hypothetical protein